MSFSSFSSVPNVLNIHKDISMGNDDIMVPAQLILFELLESCVISTPFIASNFNNY